MREQISTDEVAAILEQAQRQAPPPEWKIHRIPRHHILFSLWPGGGPLGCLVAFILFNGLLLLLMQFFGTGGQYLASDQGVIALWAICVLILLWMSVRLIRERTRQGLVVITSEQVVVFDPVRFFRQVRVLSFARVQGMVLQRVDSRHPDTGTEITFSHLELRDVGSRRRTWSLNGRYGYESRHALATSIYQEIIEQFEHHHLNRTTGLRDYRHVTDWSAF